MNSDFEEFEFVVGGSSPHASGEPPQPTGSPILSEEAAFGRKNCANCTKPHSALWCEECAENDVGQLRVFYCTESCRAQHAAAHKHVCETRRRLSRAVLIFRELWTTFEEETFVTSVCFANERNGKVLLTLKDRDSHERAWTGNSFLRQFPGDVVPGNATDAVKKAVLFDNTCSEVVSVGIPFINILLKPITKDIKEAEVCIKDPAMIVVLTHGSNDSHLGHCVLRVTLQTGETFAIDFTGAQYGWRNQLYTWNTYIEHRAKTVNGVTPLGTTSLQESAVYSLFAPNSIAKATRAFRTNIVRDGLVRSLVTYFVQHQSSMKDLLSLPGSSFVRERAQLVNFVKDSIRRRVQELCDLGVGRPYFDRNFEPHYTTTAEEGLKYQGVWLSKEQYNANKGKLNALKRIWNKRLSGSS
ncbi:hypothetical protein BKA56DRAFT_733399 [Ilyonectria sp. MPI-CAGE-AT-0026]|nr:hypothetical protein BKA56DRAFT_733399 [Ilyonectria sp. MPI-CAGE-AT-0026]